MICPIIVALQTQREISAPFLLESLFFPQYWRAAELQSYVRVWVYQKGNITEIAN